MAIEFRQAVDAFIDQEIDAWDQYEKRQTHKRTRTCQKASRSAANPDSSNDDVVENVLAALANKKHISVVDAVSFFYQVGTIKRADYPSQYCKIDKTKTCSKKRRLQLLNAPKNQSILQPQKARGSGSSMSDTSRYGLTTTRRNIRLILL